MEENRQNQDRAPCPQNYTPPTSVEELLQRYAAGERCFTDADIPDGAKLQAVNLEGANLENSFLSDADFRSANLKAVVFRNANVKCSDFRGANLEGADFSGASVEVTQYDGANLKGAKFVGARYYGYILKAEDIQDWIKTVSKQ